ncbi:MAG: hypothetical protein ACR2FY_15035 [Pirellulaceae bacterium]
MRKISDDAVCNQRAASITNLQLKLRDATREAENLESKKSLLDRDVEAALSGLDLPPLEDDQLTRARRRVLALERAIELERQAFKTDRTRASEEICKAARPEYEKILRKQASAVEALVATFKAERDFREELDCGDVSFTYWIPPCPFLGNLDIPGDAERWFKELKDCGYKV